MAKIKGETFNRLRLDVLAVIADRDHDVRNITTMRQAWDVLSASGALAWIYRADSTIDDSHIDTALLAIFPNLTRS